MCTSTLPSRLRHCQCHHLKMVLINVCFLLSSQDCQFTNTSILSCEIPNLTLPPTIELPTNLTRLRRDVTSRVHAVLDRLRRDADNVKVFEGCDDRRQAPDEVEFYVDFLLDGTVALRTEARELCVFRAPVIEQLKPPVQKYKSGERLFIRVI